MRRSPLLDIALIAIFCVCLASCGGGAAGKAVQSATATGETFTSPRPGYNPAGDQRIPAVFAEL